MWATVDFWNINGVCYKLLVNAIGKYNISVDGDRLLVSFENYHSRQAATDALLNYLQNTL